MCETFPSRAALSESWNADTMARIAFQTSCEPYSVIVITACYYVRRIFTFRAINQCEIKDFSYGAVSVGVPSSFHGESKDTWRYVSDCSVTLKPCLHGPIQGIFPRENVH